MTTSVMRYPEPSLSDVLADPIIHLVMKRDNLEMSDLQRIIRGFKSKKQQEHKPAS